MLYLSVPPQLHRQLKRKAQEEDRSISVVVTRILRKFFEDLEKASGEAEANGRS